MIDPRSVPSTSDPEEKKKKLSSLSPTTKSKPLTMTSATRSSHPKRQAEPSAEPEEKTKKLAKNSPPVSFQPGSPYHTSFALRPSGHDGDHISGHLLMNILELLCFVGKRCGVSPSLSLRHFPFPPGGFALRHRARNLPEGGSPFPTFPLFGLVG